MKLSNLKKKMPYSWKVQSLKGVATCVSYIDARDVADVLDEVCGPENWEEKYIRDSKGHLWCYLTIWIDGKPITKADVGTPSDFESIKGEASDAFKRAAVKWGIGRFLYDIPPAILKLGQYKGKNYPVSHDGTILFNKHELTEYLNSRQQAAPKKAIRKPTSALSANQVKEAVVKCKDEDELAELWRYIPKVHQQNNSIIEFFKERKAALLMESKAQ